MCKFGCVVPGRPIVKNKNMEKKYQAMRIQFGTLGNLDRLRWFSVVSLCSTENGWVSRNSVVEIWVPVGSAFEVYEDDIAMNGIIVFII